MSTALDILKHYYGYESFREPQSEIIQSVLDGNDTLALLPTGGGKSICFQVPALMKEGICIVVSPLIALMKDQVFQLKKRDIKAAAIFTGLSYSEIDKILDNAQFGYYKFLYVSPERLKTDIFIERFKRMNVSLIAVDEAHCISQWGYDFRKSYLEIAALRGIHPHVPILALTASATEKVQKDIAEKLKFKSTYTVFKKSFLRENLRFVVRNEMAKYPKIVEIIQKLKGSGIVYARSRIQTKEVAEFLFKHHINADFYHAGLTTKERSAKQDAWIQNKTSVMVCTNAFGMGIDKPDVRFVIHLDVPDSLEAYYQEAGRAGRDGKLAYAVLLYNEQEIEYLNEKINQQFPTIDTIKHIYNALCNHFAIPVESGYMHTYNFDFMHFCNLFKLDKIKTSYALKILEQQGYIQLNESVLLPSRAYIYCSNLDVYKFEIAHSKLSPLIKMLLRTYGGIFNNYTKISEAVMARQLKISQEEVENQLQFLHKNKVLSYIPANDKPTIMLLTERLHDSNLYIDATYFQHRKKIIADQILSMCAYVEQDKVCRQAFICSYFGETSKMQCMQCDVCITNKKKLEIDEDFILAKRCILDKLSAQNWIAMEIILKQEASYDKQLHQQVIRFLLDEIQIEINEKNELRKII